MRVDSCSLPLLLYSACSRRAAMPRVHSPCMIGRGKPSAAAAAVSMCSCKQGVNHAVSSDTQPSSVRHCQHWMHEVLVPLHVDHMIGWTSCNRWQPCRKQCASIAHWIHITAETIQGCLAAAGPLLEHRVRRPVRRSIGGCRRCWPSSDPAAGGFRVIDSEAACMGAEDSQVSGAVHIGLLLVSSCGQPLQAHLVWQDTTGKYAAARHDCNGVPAPSANVVNSE